MNIDDKCTTDDHPQDSFTHFGKFQMVITLQCVIQSPSCLVLGGVFGDDRWNGAISGWIAATASCISVTCHYFV